MPGWVKYAAAALAFFGAVFVARLLGSSDTASAEQRFKDRVDVIDAEKRAKRVEAALGTERAVENIKRDNAEAMKALEAEGAERARELEKNPRKLAGAAMRALQRSRAQRS